MEATLEHAQEVGVSLVADLAGQQHYGGVGAQVLQSLDERRERVLQVNDVGSQDQVESSGGVTFQTHAPGQLRDDHRLLRWRGQVGLHVGREEVQSRLSVCDGHVSTCGGQNCSVRF